jgi:thiol-disulfide isomerase/thioredoxin
MVHSLKTRRTKKKFVGNKKTVIKNFKTKNSKNSEIITNPKKKKGKIERNSELTSIDDLFISIENHKCCIIKHYATWCPHCIDMISMWDELYDELDGKLFNNQDIRVFQIASDNVFLNDVLKKYNYRVDGFPTIIKICKKGVVIVYDGERSVESIKNFINI